MLVRFHGMDVSLLTESANYHIKNSILDSNSNHLPITSRNGEQVLAEQESHIKCNHFTIRDYVSEVRKKNVKICLPFPMLDQSSTHHANALPPLHVKRFRRWDCRRCARVIVAPKNIVPNGPNMTGQSDHGSKNCGTLGVGDATKETEKSFARSLQQTESSVLIKEGTRRSKVCCYGSVGDKNGTSKPNTEACQTKEKESAITVRESTSRITPPSEDNPKFLFSKQDKTVLVHPNEISDKEEDQKLSKINKGKQLGSLIDQKNGVLPSLPDKNLDECSYEEPDTSIHFIDARKPGVSVEKSHPRKACKIRTIDDIMKSAALRKVGKNCSSSENIGAGVRGSSRIPEASKDNDEHPKHRGYSIQDKELSSIKRKKKEAVSNDGEGTCLTHWLKKVPKKPRLDQGELEAKYINNAASTSKCACLKGFDLNLEYSARGDKKKEIIEEMNRKLSFTAKQKGRTITECLQTKNWLSRSPGIIISDKDFRRKTGTIENNYKKSLLGNKKNKRTLIEDMTSSQPPLFQDSLGIQEQHEKYLMNTKESSSKNLTRISMINNGDAESRSKSKQCRHLFDLNQEAPTCASTELQSPSPYTGLSMTGAQLAIIVSNRNYFPQNFSPVGMNTLPYSEIENDHGGNVCKLLRPLPRIGILGPLLQKDITITSYNIRPTLGFMASNGAFQPLKSEYKMEECVVNRNPADFAMVDEDSEYMIGYKENKARPHSRKLQVQTHIRGHKGRKMRKLSEIKRSRRRNKASSRGQVSTNW